MGPNMFPKGPGWIILGGNISDQFLGQKLADCLVSPPPSPPPTSLAGVALMLIQVFHVYAMMARLRWALRLHWLTFGTAVRFVAGEVDF